jgi:hypothetical protein
MNSAPARDDDPHWLLGLAQVRAKHILKLVQLYEDGEIGADGMAEAVREEANAILGVDPNETAGTE